MLPNLLIIGKMGSGKDTVADFLVRQFGYNKIAMADPLKAAAEKIYPREMNSGNRNTIRTCLQKLGDLLRSTDIDILNRAILHNITESAKLPAVISDIRLITELDFFSVREFIPLGIQIPDKIRLERIYYRDGIYPDIKTANHRTETEVEMMLSRISLFLDNSGERESLFSGIRTMMEELSPTGSTSSARGQNKNARKSLKEAC